VRGVGQGVRIVLALIALVLWARPAGAINHLIALDEVLGSWQGDDNVQFVELRLFQTGQTQLANGGGTALIFDDATASEAGRRTFTFTRNIANGAAGAHILVGTSQLATVAGVTPDFVLPPGMLRPRAGRVCYFVNPPQPQGQPVGFIDCVAYGTFTAEGGGFGNPVRITPDNRSLQRVDLTGSNPADWAATLTPTPENNAGASQTLATLCGDGAISQGEECDGTLLGGASCSTLGFASGKLACKQCHYDTSRCTFCGNGAINGKEQCDGAELRGKTCEALGFTGGTLACSDKCKLVTDACDPTFFVPGGGPRGPECFAEWLVSNAARRPGGDGRAPVRQRCTDGDPGCDADATAGTCTFTVALCFDRDDARLARGARPCRREGIESWTLLRPAPEGVGTLVSAVAALGPSTPDGGVVAFSPPLEASEHCTEPVAITVPTRGARPGALVMRARAVAFGGRPRDVDALKLVCAP
jgi:hypothetical protein